MQCLTITLFHNFTETNRIHERKSTFALWDLTFPSILHLPESCVCEWFNPYRSPSPTKKAMRYYLEERTKKKFVGKRKTTIVTTINNDISKAKEKHTDFSITPLIFLVSFQNIHLKANNKKQDCFPILFPCCFIV